MLPTQVRLGKLAAKHDARTLRLDNYTQGIPRAPLLWDVPGDMRQFNFGMMENDRLGDCTAAAIAHLIQVWTYYTKGAAQSIPDQAVVDFYSLSTGYNPSDPSSDRGGVEIDVLNCFRKNGIVGNTLTAYAAFTSSRHEQFRDSVYYFGGAYLGLALPRCIQGQRVWDAPLVSSSDTQPGSWGGHAVVSPWYNDKGPVLVTWGTLVQCTWDFIDRYCDEAYALLSPDWINNGKLSPTGFDIQTLQNDLAIISAA